MLTTGSPTNVSGIDPAAPARAPTADARRGIRIDAVAARSDASSAIAARGTHPRSVAVAPAWVTRYSADPWLVTSAQSSAVAPVTIAVTA